MVPGPINTQRQSPEEEGQQVQIAKKEKKEEKEEEEKEELGDEQRHHHPDRQQRREHSLTPTLHDRMTSERQSDYSYVTKKHTRIRVLSAQGHVRADKQVRTGVKTLKQPKINTIKIHNQHY